MNGGSKFPVQPTDEIRTLRQHLDAGVVLLSFCSSGHGHSHVVDLERLTAELGPDTEIDYDFKVSQTCPECGAPGRGVDVRLQLLP